MSLHNLTIDLDMSAGLIDEKDLAATRLASRFCFRFDLGTCHFRPPPGWEVVEMKMISVMVLIAAPGACCPFILLIRPDCSRGGSP